MAKVIVFNMITLDGYMAGPAGEIDWHHVGEEFNDFAIQQLEEIGALLFGRVTYEMMASYWPTPNALAGDPVVAKKMNALPKVVFSRSLQAADWQNARLVKGDAAAEVARLRQQPGKDLFIFGSADLANALIQKNLIDEYRLMVNPVVLGSGKPMFGHLGQPLKLDLINSRTFQNGNVLLVYRPAAG